MDFPTAVRKCFRDYATFSGRATRAEFWWFALFCIGGQFLIGLIEGWVFGTAALLRGPGFFSYVNSGGPLSTIFAIVTFVPLLAVAVRRLHDTNRSGWWLLLTLIPLVGQILLLVFLAQRPRDGNRFGPPPLPAP